ncbi:zinc finger protein 277 isoform X2 [Hydra vulgaris]|uniref:Zinc finger protein 277 isoform X2 n=1 Tax=Hydra vulgaris TaxID=6087 RepID=A0ABM4D1Q0_HYDVU
MEPINISQPLSINQITSELTKKVKFSNDIECLVCNSKFPSTENGTGNPILAHLLSVHKIVIADVQNIPNFPRYISYWKEKFSTVKDLKEVCVVVKSNSSPEDKAPSEYYYMLTNFIPEDEAIRDELTLEKLENVLEEQQLERNDSSFSKTCLFCKETFQGNRAKIFKHMAKEHSFNVGNSDNIVHASEFIDLIKSKLDSFTCLCCSKQFKDWNTLKDHMRKKGHKRIDPLNKEYDKFYLINYLAPGKYWKEVQSEPEYEKENIEEQEEENTEKAWGDWTEKKGAISLCLFCATTDVDVNKIIEHMKNDHGFNLNLLRKKLDLNFYHQVKIVNYIRKKVFELNCPYCIDKFSTRGELELHLSAKRHCQLPVDKKVWDQPSYFFPTFEDDSLLCFLEDDGEDENQNIIS